MPNVTPTVLALSIISTFSLFPNALLIYLATRLKVYTKDIKYVIVIACIQLIQPFTGIVDLITYSVFGNDQSNSKIACQWLGFSYMLVVFLQLAANALLGLERLSKIAKADYSNALLIPYGLASVSFLFLSFVAASEKHFALTPAELICFLAPKISLLSGISYYFFIFSTVNSVFIIFYSYSRIAYYTNNLSGFVVLDPGANIPVKDPVSKKWNIHSVSFRIFSILFIYSLSMLSGLFFSLLHTSLSYYNTSRSVLIVLDSISILSLSLGILLNSMLLVTTHTTINKELRVWLASLFCKSN